MMPWCELFWVHTDNTTDIKNGFKENYKNNMPMQACFVVIGLFPRNGKRKKNNEWFS